MAVGCGDAERRATVACWALGIWEIALISVVALLVLGPEKLPDAAARRLGKALNDFRRAGDDIRREVMGDNLPVKPAAPPPAQTVANRVDPRMVDPAAPTSVADPATTVSEAQAKISEAQIATDSTPAAGPALFVPPKAQFLDDHKYTLLRASR